MTPTPNERGEARAIPETATAIRLVRPVGDDLREYEAMGCESGARGIRSLLRRCLVRGGGDYGLADFLDDNGDIVGELDLSHEEFRRLVRKLRCRVVTPTPNEREEGMGTQERWSRSRVTACDRCGPVSLGSDWTAVAYGVWLHDATVGVGVAERIGRPELAGSNCGQEVRWVEVAPAPPEEPVA